MKRAAVIVNVVIAVLIVGAFVSIWRHIDSTADRLARERQTDIRRVSQENARSDADVALAKAKADAKRANKVAAQVRDLRTKLIDEDARTQRLICYVLTDVLRTGASISIDSKGHDVSDCADRFPSPLIPERSR